MTGPHFSRKRVSRERFLLLGTVLSALALLAAAFSPSGDPELAGRAALARSAGEVEDGVLREWERLLRDPRTFGGDEELLAAEPAPEPVEPVELRDARAGEDPVFDALVAEARRLAGAREPGAALEVLRPALARETDAARRAEALLLRVQLAVRADELEEARAAWREAFELLEGAEAQDGTSALLLVSLAAAPALPLIERAEARDRLIALWTAGALALPAAYEAGFEPGSADERPSALRSALRRRLVALVPEAPAATADERLERHARAERARLLTALVGGPLPIPAFGEPRLVRPTEHERNELILSRLDADTLGTHVAPRGTAAALLDTRVRELGLLPEGYALDLTGDGATLGPAVRAPVRLSSSDLTLVLRHADPDRIVLAASERQALVRVALSVLAVFTAAAGFLAFRALRRERLLAALKSSFVANVSHELRTPVSSILLMAENLEQGRVGEASAPRYHGLIRREAQRLRRLIDDVLDFSALERGREIRLRTSDVDVPSFAAALEEELRESVEPRGTLAFHANGVPATIRCDADALRRATANLVDNTLKHSGTLDVEVRLSGTAEGALTVEVRDRGRGIPAGRLETIFEPFERLDEGAAGTGAAGTGLGLAIVREVVRAHGGDVTAHVPEDGVGVAFRIHIPQTTEGAPE